MTAAMTRTCRHRTDGKPCRRSVQHAAHREHGPECSVPPELHHAFVAARPYGAAPSARKRRVDSDPFVRTSMRFRRSDMTYLGAMYGTAAVKLREWIAADRGISGDRLVQHLGGKVTASVRGLGGKFVPKPIAPAGELLEMSPNVVIVEDHVIAGKWQPPPAPLDDDEAVEL